MEGLVEELPAACEKHGLAIRFAPNDSDCEVMVFHKDNVVAILDIDGEVELWTVGGGPTGPFGRVEFANPNFINDITSLLRRRIEFLQRKQR